MGPDLSLSDLGGCLPGARLTHSHGNSSSCDAATISQPRLYRLIFARMNPEQIAQLIRAALPEAQVQVESDDNTHFAARVVSREFIGKRSIARHQLIHKALGERMGREIHALSIEALTPEENGTP